jgi:diguanylate cyclase (GGDEF)-like protein
VADARRSRAEREVAMSESTGQDADFGRRRTAILALGVGCTYLALAQYIVWLNDPVHVGAGFWPAAGVTVAALLLTPKRAWAPILLAVGAAELGGDLVRGYPLGATIFWAAGNVVEPWVAAALIRHFRPNATRLAPLDNLSAFFALAVVAGPVVGATVGSLGSILWFHHPIWTVWPKYVVGDALGVLVVTPLALHVATLRVPRGRWSEAACFWVVLVGVGVLAFRDWHAAWGVVLPYLLIPVLVWAALRSGIAATAMTSFVVAQAANLATALGWGPFALAGDGTGHAVTFLQIYLAIAVGTALILAAIVDDLVSRRELEHLLTHRATHDPLTGLPNRARVYELLEEELRRARETGTTVAVLFCDLDDFKAVNDTLGHDWGDHVLLAAADRLRRATRPHDVVGRVGGDEFVVVCPDLGDPADVVALTQRLEVAVSEPVVHDGRIVWVETSIGVATSDGSSSLDEVVRTADLDMYRVKRRRAGAPVDVATSSSPTAPRRRPREVLVR